MIKTAHLDSQDRTSNGIKVIIGSIDIFVINFIFDHKNFKNIYFCYCDQHVPSSLLGDLYAFLYFSSDYPDFIDEKTK